MEVAAAPSPDRAAPDLQRTRGPDRPARAREPSLGLHAGPGGPPSSGTSRSGHNDPQDHAREPDPARPAARHRVHVARVPARPRRNACGLRLLPCGPGQPHEGVRILRHRRAHPVRPPARDHRAPHGRMDRAGRPAVHLDAHRAIQAGAVPRTSSGTGPGSSPMGSTRFSPPRGSRCCARRRSALA